jgi:hypothetical protein
VLLSPFLEEYGRCRRLFHVTNHPYRQALVYVANGILQHLGYTPAVSFSGRECIPFPHVPLPAAVQRYLRRNSGGKDVWEISDPHKYHLPTVLLSRAEYLLRVVEHLRSFPREELMGRLREPHVFPFLQRLARAAPTIPRIEVWHRPA